MSKKVFMGGLVIIIIAVLAGVGYWYFSTRQSAEPSPEGMTESEAKGIAEDICIKGGESLSPGYYNENSKTWWFDANLNATQDGCNPACVVWEETQTAEINWRCTGLIAPVETTSDAIRYVFVEKYPEYADTLAVSVDQETLSYARGTVSMVSGQPGGYFFATDINGSWEIVLDGNGQIPCELLNDYHFPPSMMGDCAGVGRPQMITVKLYYYNPDNDKDTSGNLMCTQAGLVAVDREIPVSSTLIDDTINFLLRGNLTETEKQQGIETEYPLSDLYLTSSTLDQGVLTLDFSDEQNQTSGGSCRVGVLWAQIEATAKQFDEVSEVRFRSEGLFQP